MQVDPCISEFKRIDFLNPNCTCTIITNQRQFLITQSSNSLNQLRGNSFTKYNLIAYLKDTGTKYYGMNTICVSSAFWGREGGGRCWTCSSIRGCWCGEITLRASLRPLPLGSTQTDILWCTIHYKMMVSWAANFSRHQEMSTPRDCIVCYGALPLGTPASETRLQSSSVICSVQTHLSRFARYIVMDNFHGTFHSGITDMMSRKHPLSIRFRKN